MVYFQSVILLFCVVFLARASVNAQHAYNSVKNSAEIRTLIKDGSLDEAEMRIAANSSTDQNNVYVRYAKYKRLMARKRFPEALNEIDVCTKLLPNKWYLHLYKAQLELKLNQYPAAKSDLDKALALKDGIAVLYYERGRCLATSGKKVKAREDFNKAAILYLEQGEPEQAENCIAQKRRLCSNYSLDVLP